MRKSIPFLTVFLVTVAIFYLYAKGYIFADFPSVSPRQAYATMQKNPHMAIIDVRTQKEFEAGHLEHARLVALQNLPEAIAQGRLDALKTHRFFVYCHSGMRSVAACRIFRKEGFDPVNIRGGIEAWHDAGLPIVK